MTHDDLLYAVIALVIPASIAAWAAVRSAMIAKSNRATLDTENGSTIGRTIHDMAQTVETQVALSHTNTQEVLHLANRVTTMNEKIEAWMDSSAEVHTEILSRLDKLEDADATS